MGLARTNAVDGMIWSGSLVAFCPLTHARAEISNPFLTSGKSGPECKHCKADPDSECRFCSCCVCGGKQDASMQLLCDECNMAFHIYCLNPPLTTIPDDEDWWGKRRRHLAEVSIQNALLSNHQIRLRSQESNPEVSDQQATAFTTLTDNKYCTDCSSAYVVIHKDIH